MAKRGCKPAILTTALSVRQTCEVGRPREIGIKLPEHVHRVKSGKRTYFYYQAGRGSKTPGPRLKIGGNPEAEPGTPEYLRFHAELNGIVAENVCYPKQSLGALVKLYRADDAFTRMAERSQVVYNVHLNRFMKPEAWGFLDTRALTPVAVLKARDEMSDTPGMANQMLSVGRTLYDWAIPLGHVTHNPFASVSPLETPDTGHVPWPKWVVDYTLQHMTPDLVRMVRLGIATCQRESDLIRLGPEHRDNLRGRPGIWCRPKKTRRRRKNAVFIPLTTLDALEIDRWSETPIAFTNSRWLAPIERHRADLYLYSPKGAPYSPTSLRARYHRWLATPAGAELCRRWREWLAAACRKYEWEIDAENSKAPTIHGLRGTGILLRYAEGFDESQIANDIGAHARTVAHYMRFRDQMEVAAAGRERLRLVGDEG